MPTLFSWTFDGSNHFASLNSEGQPGTAPFLILGVVLLVIWFLLTAMFVYYLVQFMRTRSDTKLYGRLMLYVNLGVCLVNLLFACLVLSFWARAGIIYRNIADGPNKAYGALTAFTVIGFITLVSLIVMMWFFLPYYGIAFDGKRILFMGEDIPYDSITKIISDKETGATYINYSRGKRSHKRLKFSAASAFGLFIKKNATLTGHAVEEDDEKAYYQSLLTSDRSAEKEFNKEVDNKVRNKSARSTSTSSKAKATTKKSTSTSKSKSKSTSTGSKSKSKNK